MKTCEGRTCSGGCYRFYPSTTCPLLFSVLPNPWWDPLCTGSSPSLSWLLHLLIFYHVSKLSSSMYTPEKWPLLSFSLYDPVLPTSSAERLRKYGLDWVRAEHLIHGTVSGWRLVTNWLEAMDTNSNTRGFLWASGNTLLPWGWPSTGMDCPKKLWNLHPWRYSDLDCTWLSPACSEWSTFYSAVLALYHPGQSEYTLLP